jgi:hypothetical protein
MNGYWPRWLRRSGGLLPVVMMLLLLVGTELGLHSRFIRRQVERCTDGLWLKRLIARRGQEYLPTEQGLMEQAANEAYLRGVAKYGKPIKVLLVGDSTVHWVPAWPPFNQRLQPILAAAYGAPDVGVYNATSQGQNHISGFYFTKAALAEFTPDLIVYVANPVHLSASRANVAERDLGFADGAPLSEAEARARKRLAPESKAKSQRDRTAFEPRHTSLRLLYSSGLRDLLYPPGALLGLAPRCRFASCQGMVNKYWRDLDAAEMKPITEAWAKIADFFVVDDRNLNFTYLMLTPELARSRGVPLVMTVPPLNYTLLAQLGRKDEVARARDELVRAFESRGVAVIDCQERLGEEHFRDTQHLRSSGLDAWAECLRGPLTEFVKNNRSEKKQ